MSLSLSRRAVLPVIAAAAAVVAAVPAQGQTPAVEGSPHPPSPSPAARERGSRSFPPTAAPTAFSFWLPLSRAAGEGEGGWGLPSTAGEILSAAQLQDDFAVFQQAYRALHPGLYRYNTRAQMDAHFDALQKALDHDQPLSEAYRAFAVFLTQIQCGHSYPNFYNQPQSVVAALFKDQDRVPFHFRWIDRRMIVTRNLSPDGHLAPGTEILSVNGVPSPTVLARLLTVSRADGGQDNKRVNNLEIHGNEQYEAFDIYYPLFFPVPDHAFTLQTRTPNGAKATVRVEALTYEQRIAPFKAQIEAERGDTPLWTVSFPTPQTAVLRMPTWAVYNSKWNWNAFLDQTFDQLAQKQTKNLLIDVRGNEGGSDVGSVLIGKLIRQDLRAPTQFQRWVRYRKVPDNLAPFLDTWDDSFKDWGDFARDFDDGFARMTKFDDDAQGDLIKATTHPFAGRVYVLVDASNSSATFEFAKTVQKNHLATLVGQPTGGSQRGINGGAFFFLRLPHSHIETDLPLIGAYPLGVRPTLSKPVAIPLPDAGLTPDILVKPSLGDIARGIDTELTALQKRLGS